MRPPLEGTRFLGILKNIPDPNSIMERNRIAEEAERACQPSRDHVCRHKSILEGSGYSNHTVPLFPDEIEVNGTAEESLYLLVRSPFGGLVEPLLLEVPNSRHEGESQEIAQSEDSLGVTVRIRDMLSDSEVGFVLE